MQKTDCKSEIYAKNWGKENLVNPGKVNGQHWSKSTVNASPRVVNGQHWSTDDVEIMSARANVALTRQQW